jgi:hypothetical protein
MLAEPSDKRAKRTLGSLPDERVRTIELPRRLLRGRLDDEMGGGDSSRPDKSEGAGEKEEGRGEERGEEHD